MASTRSSSVIDGAGPLGHPQRLAVLEQVDHLADEHLEVLARLVAERRAQRHQPADVAVVVGAEHDQAAVEAALLLVDVVGRVTGDVGALAVGLDDHPVLVVAVLLGADPQRTVLLVGVAHLGEPLDGPVDGTGLVQVVLVEVDVEVHAEVVQGLLDLVEHHVDADGAEDLLRLVVGQVEDVGPLRDDRVRDLADVRHRRSRPRASARPSRWPAATARTGRSGRRGR